MAFLTLKTRDSASLSLLVHQNEREEVFQTEFRQENFLGGHFITVVNEWHDRGTNSSKDTPSISTTTTTLLVMSVSYRVFGIWEEVKGGERTKIYDCSLKKCWINSKICVSAALKERYHLIK